MNSYSQELEYQICGELRPFVHPVFVDVGAERGSFSAHMLESGFTEGYAFEPLPRHFEQLAAGPLADLIKVFDFALDSTNRTAVFHIATDNDGNEQDYYHSLHQLTGDKVVAHTKSINVECRTLKSLNEDGVIPTHIGLLKLDTEGNDLSILKAMGNLEIDVIMCEFFMPGLYAGWRDATPSTLVAHLETLGYKKYLAIKRDYAYQSLELCPEVYLEKCWGNLIFFKDEIFEKAGAWILEALTKSEAERIAQINSMQRSLEEKESVIQDLVKRVNPQLP